MSTVKTGQRNGIHEALGPLTDALRERLGDRLVAVVLFGSRARNEAGVNSDWDLLLIADELPQKTFDRHLFVKRLLPPAWRGIVSIVAKTPQEFDASVQALYLDIALDGVVLADKEKYVTDRLAFLKRQMDERGLYRKREGEALLWRWQVTPKGDWSFEWEKALT